MLRFRDESKLKNPHFGKLALNFFNANKQRDKFWISMHDYLLQSTDVESSAVTQAQLSYFLESLKDFKRENLEITNESDYMNLHGILAKFEYKLKAMHMSKAQNPEPPASAYDYIGNNKTIFEKTADLSSLIYKF